MTEYLSEADVSTEEKILRAAEIEFMNKGFDGARTTAIAEAAGVTHAMFHYYFRTKKNLFERIVTEKIKAVQQLIMTALGHNDKPLFERLTTAISEHLDFLAANPNLPRFMITEMYTDKERMDILLSKFKLFAENIVNELQTEINLRADEGICKRVDARMLILDMLSLNMFSFIAAPITSLLTGDMSDDLRTFVELRKKENIDTIIRRLAP